TTSYRNDYALTYVDSQTGRSTTIRRPASAPELAAFGLQPLEIGEASTSLIDTEEEANVMLDSVETLRIPATVGARKIPREPGIEVNSLLSFEADARVVQEAVELYVTSWTERVAMNGDQLEDSTTVYLRGAPVGQLGAWLRSIAGATLPVPVSSLYGFTRISEVPHPTDPDNGRRYEVETGPRVVDIWWAVGKYDAPRT